MLEKGLHLIERVSFFPESKIEQEKIIDYEQI